MYAYRIQFCRYQTKLIRTDSLVYLSYCSRQDLTVRSEICSTPQQNSILLKQILLLLQIYSKRPLTFIPGKFLTVTLKSSYRQQNP